MSDFPEEGRPGRLRELDEPGPPRLVDTPAWVRPLGALLMLALAALCIVAAAGVNPW